MMKPRQSWAGSGRPWSIHGAVRAVLVSASTVLQRMDVLCVSAQLQQKVKVVSASGFGSQKGQGSMSAERKCPEKLYFQSEMSHSKSEKCHKTLPNNLKPCPALLKLLTGTSSEFFTHEIQIQIQNFCSLTRICRHGNTEKRISIVLIRFLNEGLNCATLKRLWQKHWVGLSHLPWRGKNLGHRAFNRTKVHN